MMREKLLIMLLAFFALALEMQAQEEDADVTTLLTNPYFEDGETGWTVVAASGSGAYGRAGNVRPGGSSSNKCYEAWNSPSFDIYQTITDVPVGVYEIEVQGFYRYLRGYNAWSAYQAQESQYVKKDGVPVYVYMNNNATPFVNIFAEPVPYGSLYTNSVSDDTYTDPNYEYWYPNQMNSSAEAFSAGMYKQSAFGLVAREGDAMRVGVKGVSNQGNDSWVIWDNFKLTYRGFKADVIKPVLQTAMADVQEYMNLLMGKTEYAALSTAYRNAELGIENNDGVEMFNALNALYDAKDPARLSKDVFVEQDVAADTLRLGEAIRSVDGKKLSQTTLAAAKALLAGIKNNTLYENNETGLLKSDVTQMINTTLQWSLTVYQRLYQEIQSCSNILSNAYQAAGPNTKAGLHADYTAVSDHLALLLEGYNLGTIDDEDVDGRIMSMADEVTAFSTKVENYIDAGEWEVMKTAYAQAGNGEGWTTPWDFTAATPSKANVPGVTTDDGHVVALDLSSNNLTGTVPFDLLTLPRLHTLNLSGNSLSGDIDAAMTAFKEAHASELAPLQSLNLSHNQLSGNIGALAGCFPQLTSLNASYNSFEEVSPAIPSTVTNLVLDHQTLDCVVDLSLSEMISASLTTKLPSILLYNHATQRYDKSIRLRSTTAANDWTIQIQKDGNSLPVVTSVSPYVYQGANGEVLSTTSTTDGSTFAIRFTFSEGDSNFDGAVNVLDLQSTINYAFEDYNNRPFNFTAANLWADDLINVQDVVKTVDVLMSLTHDDQPVAGARGRASETTARSGLYIENGNLLVNTEVAVAAFDLMLSAATNITIDKALTNLGITCRVELQPSGTRIIGYSLAGGTLPVGQTIIGKVTAEACIQHALLSDSEANPIGVSIRQGAVTSAAFTEREESGQDHAVYDLSGRKVTDMKQKGIYILRGKKVVK